MYQYVIILSSSLFHLSTVNQCFKSYITIHSKLRRVGVMHDKLLIFKTIFRRLLGENGIFQRMSHSYIIWVLIILFFIKLMFILLQL